MGKSKVDKTPSIWDNILEMVFKNWKIVIVILLAASLAVSGFKIKAGSVEIEKEKIDLQRK